MKEIWREEKTISLGKAIRLLDENT